MRNVIWVKSLMNYLCFVHSYNIPQDKLAAVAQAYPADVTQVIMYRHSLTSAPLTNFVVHFRALPLILVHKMP